MHMMQEVRFYFNRVDRRSRFLGLFLNRVLFLRPSFRVIIMMDMSRGMADLDRRRIGRYRVLERIHVGAFSALYRCWDSGLQRPLAVKAAKPDAGREGIGRVLLEGRVRAGLNHPHVLPLHHAVRSRRTTALVGPWLAGRTLAESSGLGWDALATLAWQLGDALDALHATGWVHGDLNSSNAMLTAGRAVLLDFGSSRPVGEAWTRPGRTVRWAVTPQIVAPEVWMGEPVDGRADLYSLGAVLYRLATGSYPFEAAEWSGYAALHCERRAPSPSERAPRVGPHLELELLRALEKDPGSRRATGQDLGRAIGEALAADGMLPDPPRRGASIISDEGGRDPQRLDRAADHLERFASTLDPKERAALGALLKLAETADARAVAELAALTTELFGFAETLLALESVGAAAALARKPATARQTAKACRASENRVGLLLEALREAGLASRRLGVYSLAPPLVSAFRSPSARPVAEAAALWRHLPVWAATGRPYLRMDRPDGQPYSEAVGPLGSVQEEAAAQLAAILRRRGLSRPGARVLDVGAGSGVWSFALAARDPALRVTALDRPAVLEKTRAHAEAAGISDRLTTLAGDWREVALPEAEFDMAMLANVCHLVGPDEAAELIRRVAGTLRPDGVLALVDTIPDAERRESSRLALHALRLALRTPSGTLHDLPSYRSWLRGAGLEPSPRLRLKPDDGFLSAILARRLD